MTRRSYVHNARRGSMTAADFNRIRKASGMSMRGISDYLGVNVSTAYRYSDGSYPMSGTVESLLKHLEGDLGAAKRKLGSGSVLDAGSEYDADTTEFLMAMERYKREQGRPFPTWAEALQVMKLLGYRKPVERKKPVRRNKCQNRSESMSSDAPAAGCG